MKAKRSFKKYMTKGYRHVRYTKGFGVHSPYAFSLITQVINEKMYYYAYDDIRRLRKYSAERRFKIKRITLKKKIPSKKLFLIYRLVNNFNPKNILQIGSEAIITYVLGVAETDSKVYSICPDSEKIEKAKSFFDSHLTNLLGDKYLFIEDILPKGLRCIPNDKCLDFVFINKGEGFENWNDINLILERLHNRSVILIEGIKKDEKMKLIWDYLKSLPSVKVSMDLYDFGLLIFHDKLYKHHYIVSY